MLLATVGLAVTAAPVAAQSLPLSGFDEVEAIGTSYHKFVRSGEASIEVLVLSSTEGSGIYEVSQGLRLDQLLALIGGSSLGVSSPQQRGKVRVRLFREQVGLRSLVYESEVKRMLVNEAENPVLQHGDVLAIEHSYKGRLAWRDAVSLVTVLTSLGLLLERLVLNN